MDASFSKESDETTSTLDIVKASRKLISERERSTVVAAIVGAKGPGRAPYGPGSGLPRAPRHSRCPGMRKRERGGTYVTNPYRICEAYDAGN